MRVCGVCHRLVGQLLRHRRSRCSYSTGRQRARAMTSSPVDACDARLLFAESMCSDVLSPACDVIGVQSRNCAAHNSPPSIILTPALAEDGPTAPGATNTSDTVDGCDSGDSTIEGKNGAAAGGGASGSPPTSPLLAYVQQSVCRLVELRAKMTSPSSVDSLSRHILAAYNQLSMSERVHFCSWLVTSHGVDHAQVAEAARMLNNTPPGGVARCEERLSTLLQPMYVWVFKQLARVEYGVKFLVDMRADVLRLIPSCDETDAPRLRLLAQCLRELLSMWFSVGFLQLERITWQSPCAMLEKVSEYEAVHPVRNWTDLKRRVGPYRRCFVFTHTAMPREPAVVLHTALTGQISECIQDIVRKPRRFSLSDYLSSNDDHLPDEEDPSQINAAVFYSISSTQKGLQGIELGNVLIKRVVRELLAEFPQLQQFSSLSPIPGFKLWLITEINKAARGEVVLMDLAEQERLCQLVDVDKCGALRAFKQLIDACGWVDGDDVTSHAQLLRDVMRVVLMRLAAFYLYSVKRRGAALDSVANFHLRNGAVMWRLNWAADLTPRGLTNSCGLMINYRYFLDRTQCNSERYLSDHEITASDQLISLAKQHEDLNK